MSGNDSGARTPASVPATGGGSAKPALVFDFLARLRSLEAPWLWSFAGAPLVWFVIAGVFGFSIAGNVVVTALVFAVFMVLVGLGQMIVITAGPGNIDLSMPSAIANSSVASNSLTAVPLIPADSTFFASRCRNL